MLVSFIITVAVIVGLCVLTDKVSNYGKENQLYINGYLHED